MKLELLPARYAVARLGPHDKIPDWFRHEDFSTISRTREELSLLCHEHLVPEEVKKETGWRIIKVQGPLDFGLTGILSSLLAPLAAAQISIFAVSTFDTDYILVKEDMLNSARKALEEKGFVFI